MNDAFDEPTIPIRLRRPLAAVWISLGLHGAVIALVQVAPPAAMRVGDAAIEMRLVSTPAAPRRIPAPSRATAIETPQDASQAAPLLAPAETAAALPVAAPVSLAPPPVEPAASYPPSATPAADAPLAPESPPVAAITSAVDLTYYTAREVDVHPRPLREIVPAYPADAERQRLSGTLRLQLKLEADGRVSDIELVSADPPDVFDESAVRAFRDAHFAPAQKDGRPVRALMLIEVVYDGEGRR